MSHQYNDQAQLLERARWLRENQTWPEKRLWARLRDKKLEGHKFRRQHVLMPFIVDFYCAASKVVVEVDGPVHESDDGGDRDAERDEFLMEEYEVQVLRFGVKAVYQELDEVLEVIGEACGGDGGDE